MNFEKRRRKLSSFMAWAAEKLKDSYNDHDFPVVIDLYKEVIKLKDFFDEWGIEGYNHIDEENLICLNICMFVDNFVDVDINEIREIDEDMRLRVLRFVRMPGQTEEEFIQARMGDRICKEYNLLYSTSWKSEI